jgi:cytochrome c2
MSSREKTFLLLTATSILILCGVLLWLEMEPGYRTYQSGFRQLVEDRFGPERAAAVPTGIQQVWIERSGKVDRCMTCHLGVSWEGLTDVKQPFKSHPTGPLSDHPVEEFGCTYCHGGQGYATRLPEAHGWVKDWDEPLLDTRLANDYRIKNGWAFLEMQCNSCHRYDRQTAGAAYLNRGKQLIREKGCRACHLINGRGGSIGPDLTSIGEKNPEQYDYSRLTSIQSLFAWQVAHLQNPKSFTADTVMPDFGLSTEEAQSVALVLMSWRELDIPAELRPGTVLSDNPTPEEAERERMMREGEGKFFVEKTCFICHDVSSFGIESATKIGPDLALAVEDAPRRFGRTLDAFLMEPSGTMQVVLSTQIPLTEEERREAIRLLKIAYSKHKEKEVAEEH